MIRKKLPFNDIKRYLVFLCSFVAGHLTNILIFKEKFNLKTVSLLVFFAFCGLVGIFIREKSFPAKKYAVTVLILISSLLVLTPLLPLLQNVRHEKTLIEYIKNDETEKVKAAIEKGADVNQTDETGATPAMWAAYSGNIELLDLLVKNGADANHSGILNVNSERFGTVYTNAINAAAGEGQLNALKYLIEKADVSANTIGRGIRDFFLSEEDISNPDGLCRFMQNSDDPISKNIRRNNSLSSLGCDNGKLTDKNRPFFRSAIAVLFSEMIKSVVIEKTNNLTKVSVSNIIDVANNRFFVDKIYGNYIKTLKNYKFFDGNKKGVTPLMEAVLTGKKEVVVYLLEKNADPNFQSEYGMTALHKALFNMRYDIAKILLENGAKADLYAEGTNGFRVYPSLEIVPKDCKPSKTEQTDFNRQIIEIVTLMFKAGAKAEQFSPTVIELCRCKNQELVAFLISYGVDSDFKFDDGRTLKEICAEHGIEIKDEWLKKKE
ncbi:ankyrin repeat domain-containing protein [bacterium]|nr:ankyrin repeat domain-containing protein [bacterium]